MSLQLRVSLPDQPGALSTVAQAIARAGADVMAVSVLESEAGRAIDEFRLRWPDGRAEGPLLDAVGNLMGVQVVACRRSPWLLDGRPDLDLLACLLAAPERGLETLVDMAPAALLADWAELRAPARRLAPLYLSGPTRHDDLAPVSMPVRTTLHADDGRAWAYFPVEVIRSVLVVGRDNGPPFCRSEALAGERIIDLALTILKRLVDPAPPGTELSELTSFLGYQPAETERSA